MFLIPALAGSILVLTASWLWGRRWRRRRGERVREGLLKRLYQREQRGLPTRPETLTDPAFPNAPSPRSGGAARNRWVQHHLEILIASGAFLSDGDTLRLSERGRRRAGQLVRGHRLLETYLADRTGHPLPRLHRIADKREHRLERDQIDELDRSLGHPVRDPHGDPIPGPHRRDGRDPTLPLGLMPAGSSARVVHVEDEPTALYRQLLAAGIEPGCDVEVLANEPDGLELLIAGRSPQRLGTAAVGQVDVVPIAGAGATLRAQRKLSDLPLGSGARIALVTGRLRGEERRRLLDLGFTPGAEVRPILDSALGDDPRAYSIRHSTVALRREQASGILVVPLEPNEPEAATP
jgi:DtxR family Mn-dependent transcriptional regulator